MQKNIVYRGNSYYIELYSSGDEEFYEVVFPFIHSWIEYDLEIAKQNAEKYFNDYVLND